MATKPTAHDLVPVVAAVAHARAGLQRPVLVAFDGRSGVGKSTLARGLAECEPAPVIVLDGAYSARPELADLVDVTVLVTLDDDVRRTRLPAREGATYMRRWHELWDAAEEYYFGHVRPPEAFDVVLTSS